MRVAIIGAGAAGLAAARYATADGHQCDILEMSPELGGIWVYSEDVGTDRYGFPVYSAMYKALRTNLPKEVMGFPGFPIPEQDKSYLKRGEVLDFLQMFVDHFDLRPLIQFNRIVSDVRPISVSDDTSSLASTTWQVTSIDKPSKQTTVQVYDVVLVCNGHYNHANIPKQPGQEKFRGQIRHSQDYRTPEPFVGHRVLVVGAGASALDIVLHLSAVAKYVVLSHHAKLSPDAKYPANVQTKPDVSRFKNEEDVEFVDGSCCAFDTIYYCTGYNYKFPFLHESCGITIDDNHVEPLYKHMIHIDRPSMCFIGVPSNVCAFQMFDLQARFYCNVLNGSVVLPSPEEMRADTERDMQERRAKGWSKRQAHLMGSLQAAYYKELAETGQTTPIAPVMVKLRDQSVMRRFNDLQNFREDRYKIVDRESFVKVN